MKAWNYLSVVTVGAIAAVVLVGACGSDDETSDDATGGSSASSSSVAVVSSSSSTSASSGGGGEGNTGTGGICDSGLSIDGDTDNPVIDGCLSDADVGCCDTFDPCVADEDCNACLQDPTFEGCDTNELFQAFQTCFDTNCPTSVCETDLGYALPNLNLCITEFCCATFTPCEADAACNACLLDPEGAGCVDNALFTAYQACRTMSCPDDICDTGIIFATTYENEAQDVAFETNACAATNCCADLTACADPTGDGHLDTGDPEIDACLLCLNEDSACGDGPVKTAAEAFNTCFAAACN